MLRDTGFTFALRLLNLVLVYGTTVALARFLGVSDYGRYSFVLAIVTLAAIPAQFGLSQLLMRETARAMTTGDIDRVHLLKRWSYAVTLRISLPIVALGAGALLFVPTLFDPGEITTYAWGLTLVVLLPIAAMRSGILRGLHKVVLSQVAQQVVRPSVQMILIGAMVLAPMVGVQLLPLSAESAMAANAIGIAVSWVFGTVALARVLPSRRNIASTGDVPATAPALSTLVALGLADAVALLDSQLGVLILGLFATDADVGLFKVAAQGALFTAMGYVAVTTSITPTMARAWAKNDRLSLAHAATRGARLSIAFALPVTVVLVAFGGPLLEFIFGAPYRAAAPALAILVVAQMLNAAFGATTSLLNMTGHERVNLRAFLIALGLNVVLTAVLAPTYGATGAAIAGGASILLRKLILWRAAHRLLGIETGCWGRMRAPDA